MQIRVVVAAVGQPVDQPGIAMEGEDHRLVLVNNASKSSSLRPCGCSDCGCSFIRSTTLTTRTFRFRQLAAQDGYGGQSFERRYVACAGHDNVGLTALIVAGPLPDTDALAAMIDGGIHRQPLRSRMLAGHDHIDVAAAAQTVIHHRQQAVGVRRQVHAHDLGFLVDHMVEKTRILMRESIVILAPTCELNR